MIPGNEASGGLQQAGKAERLVADSFRHIGRDPNCSKHYNYTFPWEPEVPILYPVLYQPHTQSFSSLDLCVAFSIMKSDSPPPFFKPNKGMSGFQMKGSITSTKYHLITLLLQLSASQLLTPTGQIVKPHKRLCQEGRTGETFSP